MLLQINIPTGAGFFSHPLMKWTCAYADQSFLDTRGQHGVRMGELGLGRIRAAFHYGLDDGDLEHVMRAFKAILK